MKASITGYPGYVDRSFWSAVGREPEPGWYAGPFTNVRTSQVECPYCYRALLEVDAIDLLRIAQVIDASGPRIEVIAERVPPTHRVLMCIKPCYSTFTVPRET